MADGGEQTKAIVVVGKSRAGKTTLITKLFHEDDVATEPGNTSIESRSNNTLTAHEVPGPDPSRVEEWENNILANLSKFAGRNVNLFLLCISVAPSNSFEEVTPVIMKSLQEEFGKKIWGNCIVIFTFSNTSLTTDSYPTNAETERVRYLAYLQSYTDKFRKELHNKLGVREAVVKTIFQHRHDLSTSGEAIITIPAGNKEEDQVIPGSEENWIDDISNLISTRCNSSSVFDLEEHHRLRKNIKKGGIIGVFGGGGTGAGVGAAVGVLGGPIGMALGAAVGAGIGAVTGGVVGGGGGYAASRLYRREESTESTRR